MLHESLRHPEKNSIIPLSRVPLVLLQYRPDPHQHVLRAVHVVRLRPGVRGWGLLWPYGARKEVSAFLSLPLHGSVLGRNVYASDETVDGLFDVVHCATCQALKCL